MPQSFLFIGMIRQVFPEAKIIPVVRDSAATCWSIYKTYFSNSNLGFCYDLSEIVTPYKEYEKIMNFWCADKRGAIRTINYDTFTADKEKQIRSLIDHLGLDWDVSCLEPHLNSGGVHTASMVQVRQPIYRNSSQDWKKYEPKLRKYFAGLAI